MMIDGVGILEASPCDAERLSDFSQKTYVDAFGADFEPGNLAGHVDAALSVSRWQEYLARDRVLLATSEEHWLGYLQYGPTANPGLMEIRRVYVDKQWHRQGVGSLLLELALQKPDIVAASAIEIDVWHENSGARRLYERFGFVATDLRKPFVLQSGEIAGYDIVMVCSREVRPGE